MRSRTTGVSGSHPGISHERGFLHQNLIDDPRYFNCCVEQVDYTPVSFDNIKEYFAR